MERILREADARALRQHAAKKRNRYAERVVTEECKKSGVSLTELEAAAVGAGSSELNAIFRFKAMEGLNPQVKRKILSDNPRRFYGI